MTANEFWEWFHHHTKCFPQVESFVAKSGVADVWAKVLYDVPLEAAKAASVEMLKMENQPYPSEHPGKLLSIVKRESRSSEPELETRQQRAFEERFKCFQCRDMGFVSVYRAEGYEAILEGTYEREKHLRTVSVACDLCELGARKSDRDAVKAYNRTVKDGNQIRTMKKFMPGVMLREVADFENIPTDENGTLEVDIYTWQEQQLFEHVTNRIQPQGYHQEFAQYGN